METTEQTIQQIERFLKKIAQKFSLKDGEEPTALTDIHIRVSQDTGEMLAFDDSDQEITRWVVEQWINNPSEHFYTELTSLLRDELRKNGNLADNLGILKPYSFVLEDDDRSYIGELYVADDDTIIIGGDLMEGMDKDLNVFLDNLLNK